MRAAVIKQHSPLINSKISSDAILIENKPIPTPSQNECLIRVKACGLNHLDTWVRRGVEGHRFPLPLVPGSDIAGVIESVGSSVQNFKKGDRVLVNPGLFCGECEFCKKGSESLCVSWGLLGETTNGGCQEYVCLNEKMVHTLPSKISFEQAACLPIAYVTAWQMLVEKANIQKGESILIHAAGSGVSIACIQIARAFGLNIFVTSSSDEKLARAKNLGATRFVNSKKESFVEFVKKHTQKKGVDVVVDHVGGNFLMDSIRSLKRGGRLVSCGSTAGSKVELDWKHVFFKNLSLLGSTYGNSSDFKKVLDFVEAGKITPVIDHTVKLEELVKAHEDLETGQTFGKIVVLI